MKRLSVLGAILALTACTINQIDPSSKGSSGDGTTSSGGETTSGGENTSGGTTSGGENTSGGTTSGGTTSGGTETKASKIGSIALSQSSFKAGAQTFFTFSASAFFAESVGTATESTCKTSTEGACQITECDMPANAPPPAGGAPAKSPHAGDITIAAAGNVVLSPDDKGAYTAKTGQTELYKPDADVSVKAKGDGVPAFDKSIKAPSNISVTAPAWPAAGTPFQLDRSKAIALTWTGGASGDVTASFATTVGSKLASVSCKYPAKDGKGDVPAAALGKLLVTDTGSISIGTSSTEQFDAGDWKISLVAIGGATAGTTPAAGIAKVK